MQLYDADQGDECINLRGMFTLEAPEPLQMTMDPEFANTRKIIAIPQTIKGSVASHVEGQSVDI